MIALPRLLTASAILFGAAHPAAADMPDFVSAISAKTIAVISDGDFIGRSYADGQLAPEAAGYRDLLTVMSLESGTVSARSVEVSNSVTAAPEVLSLSPDGKTAFVVERLKPRAPGVKTARELAPGDRLFAVDIAGKAAPKVVATAAIAAFPESLALSPDGGTVAVVSNTPDAAFLQVVAYKDGAFGEVRRFNLADLGIRGTAQGPRGGVTATNVQWHPSGDLLAVNINTQNRVAFIRIDGGRPTLWGNIVEVGKDPFVGRFTPDGAYYLTSNWGRDFTATSLEGRLPAQASTVSAIRLASLGAKTEARHEVTATVDSGRSAEGLAISPDGRLIATVNMRETAFPPGSLRFTREASVTLLTFDAAKGAIERIADYLFEGVLPEGGSFDATGAYFLATVFHGHEDAGRERGAGLEVFRVSTGAVPALERVGRIPMPHGAHHVAITK